MIIWLWWTCVFPQRSFWVKWKESGCLCPHPAQFLEGETCEKGHWDPTDSLSISLMTLVSSSVSSAILKPHLSIFSKSEISAAARWQRRDSGQPLGPKVNSVHFSFIYIASCFTVPIPKTLKNQGWKIGIECLLSSAALPYEQAWSCHGDHCRDISRNVCDHRAVHKCRLKLQSCKEEAMMSFI